MNLLDNKYFFGIVSAVGGMILTILCQLLLNRRGLLTYFVRHSRVGFSADDVVFGSVRVTWNNNPIPNLYSSTVELINESARDFENVIIRAFTSDTILLTERTEIVDSIQSLNWTAEFARRLHVEPGQEPSPAQRDLHAHQRDYFLPVINRGQIIRFHYLNAASNSNPPRIWLDVLHPGIKLEFRVRQNEIFGVPQPTAAIVGILLAFIFSGLLVVFVQTVWIVALFSLIFGLFAQIPGAYTYKAWRWLRNAIGG